MLHLECPQNSEKPEMERTHLVGAFRVLRAFERGLNDCEGSRAWGAVQVAVATLTVGFKGQAEAAAFVGRVRHEVNKEVIVSSLKEGWWT